MAARFAEQFNIASAFVPVDMQTVQSGDWVSLKGYGKVVCLLFKAAGTAGDDPVITLSQATAVAGTGTKNLTFRHLHSKAGTLTSVGTWTAVDKGSATATYTDATHAEVQAIYAIEINAEDLDVSGGFDCVQMSVADTGGNAQLGCGLYLLCDPRYPQATVQSAIVD